MGEQVAPGREHFFHMKNCGFFQIFLETGNLGFHDPN